jgi:hypothetical protein
MYIAPYDATITGPIDGLGNLNTPMTVVPTVEEAAQCSSGDPIVERQQRDRVRNKGLQYHSRGLEVWFEESGMPFRQLIEDGGTRAVRGLAPHLPWFHHIVYVLLKNVWHADWNIIAGIPGKDLGYRNVADPMGKRHGGDRGLDMRYTPRTFERNASKQLPAMLREFNSQ